MRSHLHDIAASSGSSLSFRSDLLSASSPQRPYAPACSVENREPSPAARAAKTFRQGEAPSKTLRKLKPIEVRAMLGKKRVRAIGLSLDDPRAFVDAIELSLEHMD